MKKTILIAAAFAFTASGYSAIANANSTNKRIDFCNAKVSKALNYNIKSMATNRHKLTKKEIQFNERNAIAFQSAMEKCLRVKR